MAHAFERRAVIRQIAFGKRVVRIRRLQAAQELGIKIQRHAGAIGRFRQKQFFVQGAPFIRRGADRAPIGDEKIVHIVRQVDIVQAPQQGLQAA